MVDEPTASEHAPPPDERGTGQEIVLSPASDAPIVSDTTYPGSTTKAVDASPPLGSDAATMKSVLIVEQRERTTTVVSGPLPDPGTLREYAQIYPSSVKIIFDEFKAQSAHRRDLEKQRMANQTLLSRRGQITAGILGALGLSFATLLAYMGSEVYGFGFAILNLATLLGLFVWTQESQKRELRKKEELRQKIKDKRPVEELEKADL